MTVVLIFVRFLCLAWPVATRRRSGDGAGGREASQSAVSYLKRHLESEDPTTTSVEVAEFWDRAYAELVDFEEKVLARLNELLPTLSTEARHEAELTNLPMIVQHLQGFRYRRAHWRKRLEELKRLTGTP